MQRLIHVVLYLVVFFQDAKAQLPIGVLPGEAAPDSPGWHEESLVHDGLTRWFLIYVPEDLPARAPVVILLHGGTGGMRGIFNENQSSTREWPFLAEREKFVLYVPNGVNPETLETRGDEQNWNDLREPESERDSEEDDVGFLRKVIGDAVGVRKADPLRVYFAGSSNGGSMSMRMAMEATGRIAAAAIAIVNLPEYEGFYSEPARPVPMMFVNGTEDPLMVFEGTPGDLLSTHDTVAWWIGRNDADPVADEDFYLPDLDSSDRCVIRRQNFPALAGRRARFFFDRRGRRARYSFDQPSHSADSPDPSFHWSPGPRYRDRRGAVGVSQSVCDSFEPETGDREIRLSSG